MAIQRDKRALRCTKLVLHKCTFEPWTANLPQIRADLSNEDTAAMAAAEERKHDPAAAIAAMAGQRQRVDRAIGTAINPLWGNMLEALEHHINKAQNGFGITANRFWRFDVQKRVFWNDKFNWL